MNTHLRLQLHMRLRFDSHVPLHNSRWVLDGIQIRSKAEYDDVVIFFVANPGQRPLRQQDARMIYITTLPLRAPLA